MKRLFSSILAFVLVVTMSGAAEVHAEGSNEVMFTHLAEELSRIGIFNGSDQGFELDRAPTRLEGSIIFVRLIGKEGEAMSGQYEHPFEDVPEWATSYVGFMYEKGYSHGISTDQFGSQNLLSANAFMTFILRALGYEDNVDFTWNAALDAASSKEIIDLSIYNYLVQKEFLRDDMALLSYAALLGKTKQGEVLLNKLVADGEVDANALDGTQLISLLASEPVIVEPVGEEGVFVIHQEVMSYTYDVNITMAREPVNITHNLYEGLVTERNGIIYPGIAESWAYSDDGRTLTFHLRASEWSDGTPLTAHDFVYSWNRIRDLEDETSYLLNLARIKGADGSEALGVRAVDDYTLVVDFTAPTTYALKVLSNACFAPVKEASVKADHDWYKNPSLAISNGPYILESFEEDQRITMMKNDRYWAADTISLEKVEVIFHGNYEKAVDDFNNGLVDYMDPDLSVLDRIDENDLVEFPRLGSYAYHYNMNKDVWSDVRVRQALIYAVDREAVIDAMGFSQSPATGYLPTPLLNPDGVTGNGDEYGGTTVPTDGSNIELAKQLLAQAGYPEGKGFPEITLLINESSMHRIIADEVARMYFENLGIICKVEVVSWGELSERSDSGDYDIIRRGWLGDYSDPMSFLELFLSTYNQGEYTYSNSEYDKAIYEACSLEGDAYSDKMFEAYGMLMDDMVVNTLYYYNFSFAVSDRVSGLEWSLMGPLDLRKATLK